MDSNPGHTGPHWQGFGPVCETCWADVYAQAHQQWDDFWEKLKPDPPTKEED